VRRRVSKSEGNTQVTIKTPLKARPGDDGDAAPSSGLLMWKQVSISDVLLTNEILVMRRIVENVAPCPNVIRLHGMYEDVNVMHLVLELCSGGELFVRIIGCARNSEFDTASIIRRNRW
jgi:hypothetical protein